MALYSSNKDMSMVAECFYVVNKSETKVVYCSASQLPHTKNNPQNIIFENTFKCLTSFNKM